jgi:uncharacterized coiled-coil protein SlyX
MSDPSVADRATARIIPFPPRAPADAACENGALRLRRALDGLNAALADQRKAVATWREALGDLRITMQGLSGALVSYRATLTRLEGQVAELRGDACRLENWADTALAGSASGLGDRLDDTDS